MTAPIKLLLVEDSETDAELVTRHLKKSQLEFTFHRVQTEADFRAALHEFKPDLILSDFSMPQFDGLRALHLARLHASEIPFVFVSGTIGEERAIDALHRGATDYVLKSNLTRLAPAVERALRETATRAAQRRSELQLRDNERRLRDTVETSQDWIWELDAQGRFRFCSGAVSRILGYEPEELIGKQFSSYLHEDERGAAARLLPTATQPQLTGAVARWRTTDGQVRWLESNAIVILDDARSIVGYRGADRDITARREQEARLERLTRTYRMLSSTSSAMLRLHDRGELMREVCRIAVQQGGYERAVISLIDPPTKVLRPRAGAGVDSELLQQFDRSLFDPQSERMLERTMRSGLRIICNDLRAEGRSFPQGNLLVASGYRAFAALPLVIDGTPVGVLTLFSNLQDVFDRAELGLLLELTANVSFALKYLEKDEALQFLSYFDGLTGLAKRSIFCQRLAQLLKTDPMEVGRAVIAFDVQKLSAINDSFGRYVGDRLLENIAARIKKAYDSESAAYLGGGSFAVTFPHRDKGNDTGSISLNPTTRLFAEPLIVDGQELRPAVRAGIAFYPNDADSAESLVQNAEAALKAAREDNERYMLYGLVRQRPTTRSVALEARLAGALSREELLLHYQPKIDIVSGEITGLEALLRWQDAQEGLVPPSLFIPLLERSGAIAEVGDWVLAQSLSDMRRWQEAGLGKLRVAVNVSPLQLRRRDFVERMMAAITSCSIKPVSVDIEITESTVMQDIELSIRKLADLRQAGVGVAIDDFGTGYSSLRLLERLPVDTLKIDLSFIRAMSTSPNGATLVSTIVALAGAFGMRSIAEGVENVDQLKTLRHLRCDEAQGYLFSRPVPAHEVPAVLSRIELPSEAAG